MVTSPNKSPHSPPKKIGYVFDLFGLKKQPDRYGTINQRLILLEMFEVPRSQILHMSCDIYWTQHGSLVDSTSDVF